MVRDEPGYGFSDGLKQDSSQLWPESVSQTGPVLVRRELVFLLDTGYKPDTKQVDSCKCESPVYMRAKSWLILGCIRWDKSMHSFWSLFTLMASFRGFKAPFPRKVVVMTITVRDPHF